MHIRVTCPNPDCGESFKTKEAQAGLKIRCPHCDRRLVVPELDDEDDRPEPARRKRGGKPYRDHEPAQSPWPWVVLIGGSLVVVVGSVTALLLAAKGGRPKEEPVAAASNFSQASPSQAPPPVVVPPVLPKNDPPLIVPPVKDDTKLAARPPEPKPPFNFEPLKASIAVVKGKRGHGSGFVILPNVIATNSHVIRNDFLSDVTARFIDATGREKVRKTKLLYEDKPRDLALLMMEPDAGAGAGAAPLPLNMNFAAEDGKPVTVIGNPAQMVQGLAQVNVIGPGRVRSIVMLNGKPFLHLRILPGKAAVQVGPGNSGGPVFDQSGSVIGVLSAGLTRNGRPLPEAFCIPIGDLQPPMESLGAASGYDAVSAKANARHVLDIALVQLSINAKMAKRVLEIREDVARGLANRAKEAAVIDSYKKVDRASRELSQPAVQAVLGDKNLPDELTKELRTMNVNVDLVRAAVMKPRVKKPEYDRCVAAVEQNDKLCERLKDKSGLTDDIFAEMSKAAIFQVLNKLGD